MQPHPGGWCTGKKKKPPSLSPPNTLTVSLLETHPDIRNPICLPPPYPLSSLSLSPLTPSPLSVQVAERTSAEGCRLSSPTTHGQRSWEQPPTATAPLAKEDEQLCICVDSKKRIHLFSILLLPFFLKPKRANQAVFNAQPCSSSHLAVRCCPSTTHRSSSSSPAVATCRFLLNEHM